MSPATAAATKSEGKFFSFQKFTCGQPLGGRRRGVVADRKNSRSKAEDIYRVPVIRKRMVVEKRVSVWTE